METPIKEKIRTVCLFENGQLKPLAFFWRNRNYKILRIAFTYSKNIGRETLFYFSVECENGLFELSFSREKFIWSLEKIF
ncbi:hypothetical protein COS55_02825 [Candidatus Shapirobacteria bacterium CG03_land_8_20_14_0_80_40_19]|uniref:Uncharacterized protein n=4 Tax=Candidatus Shapironibacteriota TaxID=1752721 RepID=A0A2M7BCK0_9BACT|nr:MAG: hypothetical protein COV89_00985 [Candidatus Shapirobacteria bacterium CG11_big_fil_rev_8_21_14_0_20_40_12]PIV00833.1 MAG: hypothetical protein COS55_02825 [Candidatus Shapirobacteria bacterium CG03_land_8_20_14_0_80_40_19]PJC28781.1 MAG: hypothetical protein CO053_02785 [Candidatus Shapirobacteria bacterium CG_4_9_14_0_2_um_filter_40_11]PJC77036.1 MAG: hypothetical protein CO010_01195 [Candidatus Shapirobacteria bacterium CG_4_8_14_3_um_filter_39_11]